MDGDGHAEPGDQDPDGEHPLDDPRGASVAGDAQGQAALEEDHGDGEADHGLEAMSEARRVDEARHLRAEEHPAKEEEHDGRHPQAIGRHDEHRSGGSRNREGQGGVLHPI